MNIPLKLPAMPSKGDATASAAPKCKPPWLLARLLQRAFSIMDSSNISFAFPPQDPRYAKAMAEAAQPAPATGSGALSPADRKLRHLQYVWRLR